MLFITYYNIFPAEILLWFCTSPNSVKRAIDGGAQIDVTELESEVDNQVVDVNLHQCQIRNFFTVTAWEKFKKICKLTAFTNTLCTLDVLVLLLK